MAFSSLLRRPNRSHRNLLIHQSRDIHRHILHPSIPSRLSVALLPYRPSLMGNPKSRHSANPRTTLPTIHARVPPFHPRLSVHRDPRVFQQDLRPRYRVPHHEVCLIPFPRHTLRRDPGSHCSGNDARPIPRVPRMGRIRSSDRWKMGNWWLPMPTVFSTHPSSS